MTNNTDIEGLLANIPRNGKFLYSAFNRFNSADVMAFFEKLGVPLKTERGNRVFPVSDSAFDISAALERRLKALKVQVLRDRASALKIEDGAVCGVVGERGRYSAQAVVLATGGVSYPATGSTGDGYGFAKAAGHTVTPLSPALVPFVCEEQDVRELQGLSLKNIEVTMHDGKKVYWKEFGEMLFTHFGVSGPVVLSASSYAAKIIKKKPLLLDIDLKPALSEEQLDARLLRDFEEAKNKQFKNALSHLFPSKLIPVIIGRSGIDPEKKVNEITAKERHDLLSVTKKFRVTLTGLRGYNEAIITQGGVNVREVNPSTMESKKTPGLYFAGEVLDLDGVTGGFNLQIAWSTGMLAGRCAGE